jgi:SH3 domain-containing YSC84-like protein 1
LWHDEGVLNAHFEGQNSSILVARTPAFYLDSACVECRPGQRRTDHPERRRGVTGDARRQGRSSNLLVTANCILVLPSVKKFAVGVGGSGGRGPMTCRTGKNFSGDEWSAPAMYTIGGASAGLQVGGSSTDVVLLIMAPAAVNKVLDGKVKVGTDLTAAAGPSGATATGSVGGADILSYARTKGLFAGISLNGASLEPDSSADQRLYGKAVGAREIVLDNAVKATPAGQSLVSLLEKRG